MLLFISGPLQSDSICACNGIVPFSLHLFRQICELLRAVLKSQSRLNEPMVIRVDMI